jgi:hypothetical protein
MGKDQRDAAHDHIVKRLDELGEEEIKGELEVLYAGNRRHRLFTHALAGVVSGAKADGMIRGYIIDRWACGEPQDGFGRSIEGR